MTVFGRHFINRMRFVEIVDRIHGMDKPFLLFWRRIYEGENLEKAKVAKLMEESGVLFDQGYFDTWQVLTLREYKAGRKTRQYSSDSTHSSGDPAYCEKNF